MWLEDVLRHAQIGQDRSLIEAREGLVDVQGRVGVRRLTQCLASEFLILLVLVPKRNMLFYDLFNQYVPPACYDDTGSKIATSLGLARLSLILLVSHRFQMLAEYHVLKAELARSSGGISRMLHVCDLVDCI